MEYEPYPPFNHVDTELVDKIVCKLKSQGIFDQFRKDCLADVDTKPAYQNLQQRVNGTVASFLANHKWRHDLNKNQLRESLRRHVQQGFLEVGVNRIVDQVVNPKICPVFLPRVEDVVYDCLGIEKPQTATPLPQSMRNHSNMSFKRSSSPLSLLPKDLDPVSPESDHMDLDQFDDSTTNVNQEGNNQDQNEISNDSHLSGISELTSHGSIKDFSESAHMPDKMNAEADYHEQITSNESFSEKTPLAPCPNSNDGFSDFDNFSNLKEKLKKTDPLTGNFGKFRSDDSLDTSLSAPDSNANENNLLTKESPFKSRELTPSPTAKEESFFPSLSLKEEREDHESLDSQLILPGNQNGVSQKMHLEPPESPIGKHSSASLQNGMSSEIKAEHFDSSSSTLCKYYSDDYKSFDREKTPKSKVNDSVDEDNSKKSYYSEKSKHGKNDNTGTNLTSQEKYKYKHDTDSECTSSDKDLNTLEKKGAKGLESKESMSESSSDKCTLHSKDRAKEVSSDRASKSSDATYKADSKLSSSSGRRSSSKESGKKLDSSHDKDRKSRDSRRDSHSSKSRSDRKDDRKSKDDKKPKEDDKKPKEDSKYIKEDSKHVKEDSKHVKEDSKHKEESKHVKEESKHAKEESKHVKEDDKSSREDYKKLKDDKNAKEDSKKLKDDKRNKENDERKNKDDKKTNVEDKKSAEDEKKYDPLCKKDDKSRENKHKYRKDKSDEKEKSSVQSKTNDRDDKSKTREDSNRHKSDKDKDKRKDEKGSDKKTSHKREREERDGKSRESKDKRSKDKRSRQPEKNNGVDDSEVPKESVDSDQQSDINQSKPSSGESKNKRHRSESTSVSNDKHKISEVKAEDKGRDRESKKRKAERCKEDTKIKEARRSTDRDSNGRGNSNVTGKSSQGQREEKAGSSKSSQSFGHSSNEKEPCTDDLEFYSNEESCNSLQNDQENNEVNDIDLILQRINSSIEEVQQGESESTKENHIENNVAVEEASGSLGHVSVRKPKIAKNIFEIKKIMQARKNIDKKRRRDVLKRNFNKTNILSDEESEKESEDKKEVKKSDEFINRSSEVVNENVDSNNFVEKRDQEEKLSSATLKTNGSKLELVSKTALYKMPELEVHDLRPPDGIDFGTGLSRDIDAPFHGFSESEGNSSTEEYRKFKLCMINFIKKCSKSTAFETSSSEDPVNSIEFNEPFALSEKKQLDQACNFSCKTDACPASEEMLLDKNLNNLKPNLLCTGDSPCRKVSKKGKINTATRDDEVPFPKVLLSKNEINGQHLPNTKEEITKEHSDGTPDSTAGNPRVDEEFEYKDYNSDSSELATNEDLNISSEIGDSKPLSMALTETMLDNLMKESNLIAGHYTNEPDTSSPEAVWSKGSESIVTERPSLKRVNENSNNLQNDAASETSKPRLTRASQRSKGQRYESSDLYKPRPLLSPTRRPRNTNDSDSSKLTTTKRKRTSVDPRSRKKSR